LRVFKVWRSFSGGWAIFNHLLWSVGENTPFELPLFIIKGRNGRAVLGSKNHRTSIMPSSCHFAYKGWQDNGKAVPLSQAIQSEIINKSIWLRQSSGVSLISLFD
jgi:hypothetical protein